MGAGTWSWRSGRRLIAVSLTIPALVLGSCSDGQSQPTPAPFSPAGSPSSIGGTPTPERTATEKTEVGPPFSLGEQQDEGFPGTDSALLPTAVRQARHRGYTRIVVDLLGAGTPHYFAEYVDVPIGDGSGDPITMRGNAFVQISLTGIRYPEDGDKKAPLFTDGLNGVDQIYVTQGFEGVSQVVIGVDSKVPFRVFTLEDPSRFVVDIQED